MKISNQASFNALLQNVKTRMPASIPPALCRTQLGRHVLGTNGRCQIWIVGPLPQGQSPGVD